mmetsp:Transcript_23943/g.73772  ORF Transcript_23943/g.73772 Transcript_23943/m.73772 type:complete len:237 (+) Transcript_23943:137-847(+)
MPGKFRSRRATVASRRTTVLSRLVLRSRRRDDDAEAALVFVVDEFLEGSSFFVEAAPADGVVDQNEFPAQPVEYDGVGGVGGEVVVAEAEGSVAEDVIGFARVAVDSSGLGLGLHRNEVLEGSELLDFPAVDLLAAPDLGHGQRDHERGRHSVALDSHRRARHQAEADCATRLGVRRELHEPRRQAAVVRFHDRHRRPRPGAPRHDHVHHDRAVGLVEADHRRLQQDVARRGLFLG